MTSRLPKLHPRIIKGILFDLDGTCVDSEFLSTLNWAAVLKEIGVKGLTQPKGREQLENALAAPELRGVSKYLTSSLSLAKSIVWT